MIGLTLKLPNIGLIGSTTNRLSLKWEDQWVTWESAIDMWEDAYSKQTTDIIWRDADSWVAVVGNWEDYL